MAEYEDYRRSVGQLENGVLRVELEAREVAWLPWGEDGPPILAHAFAADGERPRVPAPLIRVRAGTPVEVRIRNSFDTELFVRGLRGGTRIPADRPEAGVDLLPETAVVAPGATEVVSFTPTVPGTYVYTGRVGAPFPFFGGDPRPDILGGGQGNRQWIGLFVVDPPMGPLPREDLLLITHWGDPRVPASFLPATRFFINGRSWPHTQRLEYAQGDTVRWRVVNMSGREHPMHLHGFYFTVEGRGDPDGDVRFPAPERRLAVTETLEPGESMRLTWVATEPGNWVFHCHFMRHMSWIQNAPLPEPAGVAPAEAGAPGRQALQEGGEPAAHPASTHAGGPHVPGGVDLVGGSDRPGGVDLLGDGEHPGGVDLLGGLVVGITVRPRPGYRPAADVPRRTLRLHITRRAHVFGGEPGYGFVLQSEDELPAADSVRFPGSPLVLNRDEPTEILVHNRADVPLGVHWHGLELESWADGVPGWSGMPGAPVPAVAPGDSLAVRMTPPRSGTFMYHVHSEPGHQLAQGLYGAFLVMEPGEAWDPARDHVFLLGSLGTGEDPPPAVNGRLDPGPLELEAGTSYRFRFMHISPDDDKRVQLVDRGQPVDWELVAKDGADLPPAQRSVVPAELRIHVGETYDVLWTPAEPGALTLRIVTTFDTGAAAFPRDAPPPHTAEIPVRVR